MVRTLDFIFLLQTDDVLREKIYGLMLQPQITEYDLNGWHFSFDSSKEKITITSNGTDENILFKFYPDEMNYYMFYALVEKEENPDNNKMYFRYLTQ